jgi:Ca2+-binding EF-hand superfamily protein
MFPSITLFLAVTFYFSSTSAADARGAAFLVPTHRGTVTPVNTAESSCPFSSPSGPSPRFDGRGRILFAKASVPAEGMTGAMSVVKKGLKDFIFDSERINKYIDQSFENSDLNENGALSFDETYDLVLQVYVKINRNAPLDPPSRKKILDLFKKADTDNSGQIQRSEFKQLALVLVSRASTRLASYKILTVVGAPFLALQIVHFMSEISWLYDIAADPLVPTVLTTVLVSTLGNKVIEVTGTIFDVAAKREME